MKVYLNSITGIEDAIVACYISKRTWTRELEEDIRNTCARVFDRNGKLYDTVDNDDYVKFCNWMNVLVRWGWKHITLLRYIDFSITVEGLHRGGQDDWDAHAKRYENRIIRSSTRLAEFGDEMSDYYKDKICPTDKALQLLEIQVPDEITLDGVKYVKTVNGYVREDLKDNKDAKRGLYMLSIPSNFLFKVNLTEWAHVFKERNKDGAANPEVKDCCEMIADKIEETLRWFNRELFNKILN